MAAAGSKKKALALLAALGTLALAGTFYFVMLDQASTHEVSNPPNPIDNPELPAIGEDLFPVATVSAKALSDGYRKQLDKFEEKYTGKALEITGRVSKVDLDRRTDEPFVDLEAGDHIVRFWFWPGAKIDLAYLPVGTPVAIRGICLGIRDGLVQVNECEVPDFDRVP